MLAPVSLVSKTVQGVYGPTDRTCSVLYGVKRVIQYIREDDWRRMHMRAGCKPPR